MRLFFLLFFFSSALRAEEIVVHLAAHSSLQPLYLEIKESDPKVFSATYVKELEEVLCFDFNHNGKTQVTKNKTHTYSIKATVSAKNIAVHFSDREGNAKKLEPVALTGKLNEDRRKIHKISDAIFESFFQEKGISSSHILYTVRQKNGEEKDSSKWKSEVWESDYDGANSHPRTAEQTLCVSPIYLPNRQGFLYVTYKTGQSKIYCSLGQEKKKVSQIRGNQFMPSLSAKGDLLAFVCDATGNPEIYLLRSPLQGTEKPWQITSAPNGAQASPTLNPNGKQIAFVSNKDGTARIYTMNVPSSAKVVSKPVILTKMYKDNTSPSWSPDGKYIAYSALTKGVRQIFIYDLASKRELQVTRGGGHKENPSWALNSRHLVYDCTDMKGSDLYLIDIEEKEPTKISKGSGEKRFPSWQL